jgi:pimeloyl-ACP methyl ester carboxylesterase
MCLLTLLACLLGGMSSGCQFLFGFDPKSLSSEPRMDKGLTLVLPGIEGRGIFNNAIRDGLVDGGVPTAINIHEWTLGPILAVVSEMWEGRARYKADELADRIHAYKLKYPGRPVVLVGHSGGCAVAMFALEKLPANVTVDSVVMLGPSISQDYNLARALRHVDGLAYCYYSEKDFAVLGVATVVFGSMDGKHASAAGRYGFTAPATSDDIYAKKLRQIAWDPEMGMASNSGGHLGWANQSFVREYVARQVNMELTAHAVRMRPSRVAVSTRPDDVAINRRPAATTRPAELNSAAAPSSGPPDSTRFAPRSPDAWPMIQPTRPH